MDDPSADPTLPYSQAGTQRLPGIAPILKRRRAAPTATPHPHSPPALGAIPFRTAGASATSPALGLSTLPSQADTDGTLDANESRTDRMVEGEEEGLEGRHSTVGAAAKQITRCVIFPTYTLGGPVFCAVEWGCQARGGGEGVPLAIASSDKVFCTTIMALLHYIPAVHTSPLLDPLLYFFSCVLLLCSWTRASESAGVAVQWLQVGQIRMIQLKKMRSLTAAVLHSKHSSSPRTQTSGGCTQRSSASLNFLHFVGPLWSFFVVPSNLRKS